MSALFVCLVACIACGAPPADSNVPSDPFTYRIEYALRPDPGDGSVEVTASLSQGSSLLREMRFRPDESIYDMEADGDLSDTDGLMRWLPPATGGTLRWQVRVAHRRNGNGHDAWLGPDWGLFRAEDVIPRAATRTLKGARSETWLTFELPNRWSAVSQYFGRDASFRVDNPARRFDQPSGWIVVGNLGVRRDTISGVRVAVAGPVGESIRRMDVLALLNWTLPELARLLPELPARLTIVSAGEPMWRGGLSAPQSLYLHAERPLISENATSTLLHEVLHMTLGITAEDDYDWLVEGLAEYYSLELLRRSGTISASRYAAAKADLASWSKEAATLCRPASSGATTALAVTLLTALNQEILEKTDGDADLDELTQALWHAGEPVGLETLIRLAEDIAGAKLDALHIDKLPGCRTIASSQQAT